jgi:hypothetical protein
MAFVAFGPSPTGAPASVSTSSSGRTTFAPSAGPGGPVCPPGVTRCSPAPPPTAPAVTLWEEAVVVLGLAPIVATPGRREHRRPVRVALPVGVRTAIRRPPRPPLFSL